MHYDVCDYISDAVDNSLNAGADQVRLTYCDRDDCIICRVRDNGSGMEPAELKRALDPFYSGSGRHPERSVGLGLPFIRRAAFACGGSFSLTSHPGKGTRLRFSFSRRHIDTPPAGDWPATAARLLAAAGKTELIVDRITAAGRYRLRRSRLEEVLGPLDSVKNRSLTRQVIADLEGTGQERKTG